MTRILSALILLPLVIGTIWFLPPVGTLSLALVAAFLAFIEYANLAQAQGASIPRVLAGAAVLTSCIAIAATAIPSDVVMSVGGEPGSTLEPTPAPLDIVILSAMIVIGAAIVATRRPGPGVLRDVAASLFPMVYIGLPLGALAAIVSIGGRAALLLLLAVIVISDSAQYYTGRTLGRRPLAPAISPKKTIEGAVGGLVFGTLAMMLGGHWTFPSSHPLLLAIVGATITALGIVGDLFESLLKRSAGVKDSSSLIPGHGGVLDRIDGWLFAAPVYYMYVRYFQ
jgi:phosphatidate cytidylyltransferase